jgi:LacI family transcriptional regulator
MKPKRNVLLLIKTNEGHYRRIITGVGRYARLKPEWNVRLIDYPDVPDYSQRILELPSIHGVITSMDEHLLQPIIQKGIPIVSVSSRRAPGKLPRVASDDIAAGALAAEHLIQHGYRNFGVVGQGDYYFSLRRQSGFEGALHKLGKTTLNRCRPTGNTVEFFKDWLKTVNKPIGVFVVTDHRASQLMTACQDLKVHVPQEVAIIGVDNDETYCTFSPVPISSVDLTGDRIGYEAGEMLDLLIRGRKVPNPEVLIPPTGVVVRNSSDLFVNDDSLVAEALQFINLHACEPAQVPDILRHVNVSRRTLEQRFRKATGRSLHDEIRRVQFEKAKQLLIETDWTVARVAKESGFQNPKRFTLLFHDEFDVPPMVYRGNYRSK